MTGRNPRRDRVCLDHSKRGILAFTPWAVTRGMRVPDRSHGVVAQQRFLDRREGRPKAPCQFLAKLQTCPQKAGFQGRYGAVQGECRLFYWNLLHIPEYEYRPANRI